MTKYFRYKGQLYKAVLWIATRTVGFSVVEWPDFKWLSAGCIEIKQGYHTEFSTKKVESIDYYIERWKLLKEGKL